MAKYILVHGIRIAKDFTSETFGRLTTIGPIFLVRCETGQERTKKQVCQCDCGSVVVVRQSHLLNKNTRSCGCQGRIATSKRAITHGWSRTSEYRIWVGIKARCNNGNLPAYPNYGGRGITVCDRWREPNGQGFLNFLADMGERPSKDRSLDRIDNNGNYEPDNCRWATNKTQTRNTRRSIHLTFQNKTQCLADWAKELGIPKSTLEYRIKQGWSMEKAFGGPQS